MEEPQAAATIGTAPELATEASPPAPTEPAATSAASAAQEMDPCSLLRADQVEQVYGEDPGEPEPIENDFVGLGAAPACLWSGVGARVTLLLPPPGSDPQAFYDETIRRMHPKEPLEGFGDEAWIDPADGDLLFRTEQTYILVEHVPNRRSIEAPELTPALAEHILANMP